MKRHHSVLLITFCFLFVCYGSVFADTINFNRAYLKILDVDFYERGVLFFTEKTQLSTGQSPYLDRTILDRNGTNEFVCCLQGKYYLDMADSSTHL